MRTIYPLKAKLESVRGNPGCFDLEPGIVIFNGNCDECVPYCESLCCQIYDYVTLTEEEVKTGLYEFIEEDPHCDCVKCVGMRELGIKYSLPKKADYSCVYLDENKRCGIYETRPQTCRDYNCKDKVFPFENDYRGGISTNRSRQEQLLIPLKAKLEAVKNNPGCFELASDSVIFNGNCDECVPYCGSLCCELYEFVKLTEEEAKSGRYEFIAEDPECNCERCVGMRDLDIHYTLPKKDDFGCIYLDKNKRCSIYEIRPQTCRDYTCKDRLFPLELDV